MELEARNRPSKPTLIALLSTYTIKEVVLGHFGEVKALILSTGQTLVLGCSNKGPVVVEIKEKDHG